MNAALETVDLGRRYRTKWGLRDCTLAVPEGSITGLVGPNGAGKSTLLRLAAGLSRPSEGTVRVFGEPVNPNATAHLGRLGYFDQLRPLYDGFRVGEMLQVGRRLNAAWDGASATKWLQDLSIPLHAKVKQLSVGQQAQVALAVCMGKRPDLLLLDEPVASLDPLARRQLLQTLMGAVAEHGTTVFLSSHIVSELEPVCDYMIILAASRVVVSGSIEALRTEHRLLVGQVGLPAPAEVEVISSNRTGRQSTLLVRGRPKAIDPGWEVLEPSLEEIVLAHLTPAAAMPATGVAS
jgi:ABC-2 type transport system ATP-binding protein